jgi:hypothetical protein
MPTLHKYVDRDEYYVLTSISGKIITFQLTQEGQDKILKAGLDDGVRFGRALLIDLYRSGFAFTHGSGPWGILEKDERQMKFDFPEDPEPETIFPSCSNCSSLDDLHFVIQEELNSLHANMLCSSCRKKQSSSVDTSIPLPLISRSVIAKLFEIKKVSHIDGKVKHYQDILRTEYERKWEETAHRRTEQQNKLFGTDDDSKPRFI